MMKKKMMQFIYDERESGEKQCEVYILIYNNKIYYSGMLFNPVKLEINRSRRKILINNIRTDIDEDICREIFKYIHEMKEELEIESYEVSDIVSSGLLYRRVYSTSII